MCPRVRIRMRGRAGDAVAVRAGSGPHCPAACCSCGAAPSIPTATRPHARRPLHLAAPRPARRSLPGRVHPVRRARRAVHLEYRSHPMKPIAPALALAAVLALPATAAAHPSVYKDIGYDRRGREPARASWSRRRATSSPTTASRSCCGRATASRPAACSTTSGCQGPYRATLDWSELIAQGTPARRRTRPATSPRSTSEEAVRAWQGEDPFYAYVPFQKASAGLEDDPATWIAEVKERTGVDLATVADPVAAVRGVRAAPTCLRTRRRAPTRSSTPG